MFRTDFYKVIRIIYVPSHRWMQYNEQGWYNVMGTQRNFESSCHVCCT